MGSKIAFSLFLFYSLVFLGKVRGLQTVPVSEDLIGPGKCPTGSFCIDTDFCTQEYYTTISGMPFYCGPHHEIDSMICCLSIEPDVGYRMSMESTPIPVSGDYNTGDDEDVIDFKRLHRSNPNITLHLGDSDDDDEVDILSVNNELADDQFDVPLPNSDELGGHFDTLNDLESLVEEAIEQELNSAKFGGSPLVDDGRRDSFIDNEVPETGRSRRPPERDGSTEDGNDPRLNPTKYRILDKHMQKPKSFRRKSEITENESLEEMRNVEGRFYSTKYDRYQDKPTCACEKGEKGEPGPKGEPGEPGKIVYIPVFVNGESGSSSGFQNSMFGPQPWQFDPSGNIYDYPYSQQHQRPVRQANVPPLTAQQPPSTVIPYQVPISGLLSLSLTQNNPQEQIKAMAPQYQPHPPIPIPQPLPGSIPQPPSPLSMAYPDDLQDRLARKAPQRNRRSRRAN